MKLFVAVNDWFEYLRAHPALGEANFWQPSGGRRFRAIAPGEPLLFKLHAPRNFIVGGGFVAKFDVRPYRVGVLHLVTTRTSVPISSNRARIAAIVPLTGASNDEALRTYGRSVSSQLRTERCS